MTLRSTFAPAARPEGRVFLQVEEPRWRTIDLALLRRAARLALRYARPPGGITILLAGDDRLRRLNEQFRGKARPTNVLSFPSTGSTKEYLGDIAVAYGVAEREARSANKSLGDHAAHLVVHGVLHLAGYDHVRARDARAMEGLEALILTDMGIGDPYAIAAE